MKVLYCKPSGGAFHYITASIIRCLNAAGIQARRWDGKDINLIKEFKPDLYMGCSGHPQNFPQWARQEYGTKVGIHVNPYSPERIPKVCGMDLNEPQSAVRWTVDMKPDFVYCYADGKQIERWYRSWRDIHGYQIIPMENAGDPILYHKTGKSDEFKYEIGFLGGYWSYKAHNLDKYIKPLMQKYKCGIFGWGGWGTKSLTDTQGNMLFASSKICPAVSEPHTTIYGIDIPERVFKVPLSGGFTICDPVHDFDRLSGGVIPHAKSEDEWFDIIDHYMKNDDERRNLAEKQREHIMSHHTYFDRMANLFSSIGYIEEAEGLIAYKNTLR